MIHSNTPHASAPSSFACLLIQHNCSQAKGYKTSKTHQRLISVTIGGQHQTYRVQQHAEALDGGQQEAVPCGAIMILTTMIRLIAVQTCCMQKFGVYRRSDAAVRAGADQVLQLTSNFGMLFKNAAKPTAHAKSTRIPLNIEVRTSCHTVELLATT